MRISTFLVALSILIVNTALSGILVLIDTVGTDVSAFIETVDVHMSSWKTVVLDDPTLGEVNWRLADLSSCSDDVIFVFFGKVLERGELFGMLKDSNENYPNESSLRLSDLGRVFLESKSLTLMLFTNPVSLTTLRRIAWKGYNVLFTDRTDLTPVLNGLRGDADLNGDGVVDLKELARSLSGYFASFVSENVRISVTEERLLQSAYTKIRKAVISGVVDEEKALKILSISLTENWKDLKPILMFGSGKLNLSELLEKIK